MKQLNMNLAPVVLLFNYVHIVCGDVIVNTTVGQIRGYHATDGDYDMFMGIPYAVVNRSNPFGEAIEILKWEGIFEANNDTVRCPQIESHSNELKGSLDCLHVFIYVPNSITNNEPLAVMIAIFGGGFENGFAGPTSFGPKYLMKQNIILVSINYRLGPYGFMCLNTPQVPGNQGLKDQMLGMKWVKKNIGAFGGDPNRITIFGNSAGGMAVDLHLLSEQDKVYDRAIIQSSSSFVTTPKKPNKAAPFLLAKYFGQTFDDINEAISFLATIDPLLVIQAAHNTSIMDSFRPCIETKMDGVEHFITNDWLQKEAMPKVENMEIMTGFTTDEGLFLIRPEDFRDFNHLIEYHLGARFDIEHKDFKGMVQTMRHYYMGDDEINKNHRQQVINFISDFYSVHPVHRSLHRFLINKVGNVFLYLFAHVGARNYVRQWLNATDVPGGAIHADELGFLYDMENLPTPNATDQLVIDMMTTLWANFAKYGDPTPQTTPLLPVKWPPITNGSKYLYLELSSELRVGSRPYHDRMAFWDLFIKANHHLERL